MQNLMSKFRTQMSQVTSPKDLITQVTPSKQIIEKPIITHKPNPKSSKKSTNVIVAAQHSISNVTDLPETVIEDITNFLNSEEE